MLDTGIRLLTIAIGILYLWAGALKLFPETSPLEPLIREAYSFVESWWIMPLRTFIVLIGLFEMLIGVGMLVGRHLRVVVALMWLQLVGAMLPLILAPERIWSVFPWVWTLEGQYVVKDVVLVACGVVIWGWGSKYKEKN